MKNMKKTIALLLVLILCVSILASCGSGVSGKYLLTEMTSTDGETVKWADQVKEMKDMYAGLGMDFNEEDFVFYIEFLKDGKCKMVAYGVNEEGTFKVEGKNITITISGESNTVVMNGNKITIEEDGAKLIFEKKK